jgi:hypothetical protein
MKNRLITSYTEIQSDQINELQAYNKDNFRILIDDIVGCTSGTAKGLATTIENGASRIVAVTSGVVCDGNGLFYELPNTGTITLANTDGTHFIYALQGSATGGATSGYVLFDITNRIEDFQTIYTLTYDAISIGSTLSTIPANSHLIATGTVAGGVLTVLTDMRSYVQIGDIVSNTLNGMSIDSRNTAFINNEITGTVMKRNGKKPFVEVLVDNAFAGVGIDINNGTNTSATGIAITTSGNKGIRISGTGISFEANNSTGYVDNSSNIGFKSVAPSGFVAEGTNGFISSSSTGFRATGATGFVASGTRGFTSTSVTGFISNGITSDTVGFMSNINSTNAVGFKGMVVDGIGVQLLKNAITTNTRTAIDINSNVGDSTSTFAKAMSIKNSNLGIHYYNPDVTSSTGMVIESSDLNDDYGISLYNMFKGISIYNSRNDVNGITIIKDASSPSNNLLNTGVLMNLKSDSIGLAISNDSSDVSDNIGGIVITNSSTNNFIEAISIDGYKTGIKLENSTTTSTGSVIVGEGTKSAFEVGQAFYGLTRAIRIENCVKGIDINVGTTATGIVVTGDNSSASVGILSTNMYTGLKIRGANIGQDLYNIPVGIKIDPDNNTKVDKGITINEQLEGIFIDDCAIGINIRNNSTVGLNIEALDSKPHMRLVPNTNSLPSSGQQLGDMYMLDGGTTNTWLYIWGHLAGSSAQWNRVAFFSEI